MPLTISLWAVLLLLATGAIALGSGRSRTNPAVTYGASLATCSVILLSAAVYLTSDHSDIPHIVRLPIGLPVIGAHFRLDPLAAFFSIVVNLGGAVTSLYGLGYGRHETAPGRVLPFFPMFLAGMNLVVLADDAFSFLFSWELMSLVSWALVMAHHRGAGNARAGYVYLVTAAFGTLCLLLALGLLAGSGGYTFEAVRQTHPAAAVARLVLALVLLGAGSKAGLVPLHVWLPLAHPAAPSHVSALMGPVGS